MLRATSVALIAALSAGGAYFLTQSNVVSADSQPTAATAAAELDTTYLKQTYPGIEEDSIRKAEAGQLFEVRQGSAYGYVTADGRYLVQGDLIDLTTGVSITEQRRDVTRREVIQAVGEDSMIVFTPPNGKVKHVVNIFTDVDCGYCRKLHAELDEYHAEGIEIRYLMYPRSGPGSSSFEIAENVWCEDNRQDALTRAKARQSVADGDCATPIMQHYRAGQAAGLRGTPMMVLEDGSVISGYVPAARLAAQLDARS